MKCSIFVALALTMAVSAAPPFENKGNQGQKGAAGAKGAGKGINNAAGGKGAAASTTAAAAAASGSAVAPPAAAANGTANSADAQSSLTLLQSVIATGFANNGQDVPEAGQVASLTSTNNFINFCATVPNLPITNGKQITTGSCNPAPMGAIPATTAMPSCKFTNPKNGDTIKANTAFTISMAIQNMETGNFVNANENYFAAPQQLNNQGQIVGHSHVVVEQLTALDQTTPTDPTKFAFFKGLNAAAVGGVLTADVTAGLPAGVYKVSSINTAANHQPVLGPIAQHGSFDDVAYFTVTDSGAAAGNSTAAAAPAAGAANATAAAPAAASATVAVKNGANGGKQAGKGANNAAKGANKGGRGRRSLSRMSF